MNDQSAIRGTPFLILGLRTVLRSMIGYVVGLDLSINDFDGEPAELKQWTLKRPAKKFHISFCHITVWVPNLLNNLFLRHGDRNLCRTALVNVTRSDTARERANEPY